MHTTQNNKTVSYMTINHLFHMQRKIYNLKFKLQQKVSMLRQQASVSLRLQNRYKYDK